MNPSTEVVQIRKTADVVEKHPVGFVWSECKEKALPLRDQTMLGAFHSTRKLVFSDNSRPEVATEGSSGTVTDPLFGEGPSPRADELDEPSTAGSSVVQSEAADDSSVLASYVSDRILGSRQASDSKSEKALLKKSWLNVHKGADELLARALTQCSIPPCPLPISTAQLMTKLNPSEDSTVSSVENEAETSSFTTTNKRYALPRATMEEVLPLLEEASHLPAYINSPGESVGETIRTMLGELLKYVMEARIWAAEVRDALHGPARKDQATTLALLKRLLKQGEDTLRVIPLQELQSFRRVLNEAKLISKEGKGVLSCCAPYFGKYGGADGSSGNTDDGVSINNDAADAATNDGEDDEDDELTERQKRVNSGRGRSGAEYVSKDFSMEYVKYLIDRFKCLPSAPVLRRELSGLNAILSEATKLTREADELLVKADTFSVRKYKYE
jgi:hypothetical protein